MYCLRGDAPRRDVPSDVPKLTLQRSDCFFQKLSDTRIRPTARQDRHRLHHRGRERNRRRRIQHRAHPRKSRGRGREHRRPAHCKYDRQPAVAYDIKYSPAYVPRLG